MSFYSGYACDDCKKIKEFYGLTAHDVLPITHLRREAKAEGWSVGAERILCNDCRKQKNLDSATNTN